jgi:cephalosporin-C deacetylase
MIQQFRQSVFKRILITILCGLFYSSVSFAQEISNTLSITIEADRSDWRYVVGEKPKFKVSVLENGKKPKNVKLKYKIGPEKMPAFKTDSIILSNNDFMIDGYTLQEPGFLRCEVTSVVNGKTIRRLVTVAFSPEAIKPTIEMPEDFNEFWTKSIAQLKNIPLDAKAELMSEYSTNEVNVYHVNFKNINNSRIYGTLSVPKKSGKYPAALKVPGAGARPYKGDVDMAKNGIIVLEIGIHGIPINLDTQVYEDLKAGGLYAYHAANLDDKDNYYYKRVYLGCIKAVDFLISHESYDGKNLAVYGGSQGGALAIVTAALDSRVKFLTANYPALCDVTGYLHNRAGGWPHLFGPSTIAFNNKKDRLETCKYYDVVNFAKNLKVPGHYSWGFNDEVCPPTSMYAAYNSITATKELLIYKETGHSALPEQRAKVADWLVNKLKN